MHAPPARMGKLTVIEKLSLKSMLFGTVLTTIRYEYQVTRNLFDSEASCAENRRWKLFRVISA